MIAAGFAAAVALMLVSGTQAATIFITNDTTPKLLASNEADASVGLTNGTINDGLRGDKTGDITVLALSADDGGGPITFNTSFVSSNGALFMDGTSMGHVNAKWGNQQNWTFSLDQTISFDGLTI